MTGISSDSLDEKARSHRSSRSQRTIARTDSSSSTCSDLLSLRSSSSSDIVDGFATLVRTYIISVHIANVALVNRWIDLLIHLHALPIHLHIHTLPLCILWLWSAGGSSQ